MRTVLLTGFEPFAGDTTNASGDAVEVVAREWDGPERLVAAILPVEFRRARDTLVKLLVEYTPEIVIATGLAGGRPAVTPERIAINLMDARIPDNAGFQPTDEQSAAGAPAAYFSTLPVKAIAAAIAAEGIPASLSHSAGTFVCNHTMFAALDLVDPETQRAGFIHVPYASEHAPAGEPSLPLADIARALRIAVRTALDTEVDDAYVSGTIF